MGIKKFRFFLASDIEKEEAWLTEMSRQGLHFYKYKFGMYYFEEDPNVSYVYQTDFHQQVDDAYFQLYKDASWEHVTSYIDSFHYFRTKTDNPGIKKIYSDAESAVESLKRMMKMYMAIFLSLIVIQIALLLMWRGSIIDYFSNGIVFSVILLYVYLLSTLRKRIKYYLR
ncbi:DUF2812 domain-containing protein [Oceanobacillus halophilus]|nr:DUF2812 domain-containing protein [Oceanobacillus halophilus]